VIEADRADCNRAKLDHDLIVAITSTNGAQIYRKLVKQQIRSNARSGEGSRVI